MSTFLVYLIVCPMVMLAGFIDGIAGGGGLISLPAYLIAGVPPHAALATNKMSSAMGTAVSTGRLMKHGFVPIKLSLIAATMSILGSTIGAHLALYTSDKVISRMMMVVLPIVAIYVLRNRNLGENEKTGTITGWKLILICMACALVVGTYDGFYGPGTGTFLILALTTFAKMDTRSAAGATKVMNLSSNVAALVTFLMNGQVQLMLGFVAGIFSIAGHYLGAGMVTKNGMKAVRPVVMLVLVILFIKILTGN